MYKRIFFVIVLLVVLVCKAMAQIPRIVFTENLNQWDSRVLFRAQLYQGFLYAEKNGLTYYFTDASSHRHSHSAAHGSHDAEINEQALQQALSNFVSSSIDSLPKNAFHENSSIEHHQESGKAHAYKVQFVNMNKKTAITPQKALPGIENYYKGNNPSKWAQGVKSFESITYSNIYSQIDLMLYDHNGGLKYDFIVKPGGKPSNIQLQYSGIP
ncbi:MAG TPA: hypothetical protein PK029_02850, partial [Bacteroidales bacterium]|nr:hypothetical protein [Bacteroidales bacterium]